MSAAEDTSDDNFVLASEGKPFQRPPSNGSQSPPYSSLGDVSWSSRTGSDRPMETVFEAPLPPSSSSTSIASFESAVSELQGPSKPRSILRVPRDATPKHSSSSSEDGHRTGVELEDDDDSSEHELPASGQTSFIDLHGQINQPITKSPLLMSCYMTHMTQLQCSYWTAAPPQPHATHTAAKKPHDPDATLTPGQSLGGDVTAGIPQYSYTKEGFTPNLMVNKKEPKTPPGFHSPSPLKGPSARHFFPDTTTDDYTPGMCSHLVSFHVVRKKVFVS
jgi:hypothetical protein